MNGQFTLEQALEGDATLADAGKGKLYATIETDMGKLECQLFEQKTPTTIANFVGLARGTRPWLDAKDDTWKKVPLYDGVPFHRVIPKFMVQTGDPAGSGTGGPGYVIKDEFDPALRHTGAGILSMANRGKNTGSSQFFITVAATPHLDDKHTVFGKCKDAKVAISISEVKRNPMDRPLEPVHIKTIKISRK
jgi:cyclophilin family peptidyl-prolyl cis-trans isomerase